MKAIILAAGRGMRMGELTSNSHKCLSRIHGIKLIDIQINSLLKNGINDIALVTGYNSSLLINNKIKKYFHNQIWNKSNMVYSLFMADEWLSSERCIVSYSDIFYSPSAINSLKNVSSDIAITYDVNWFGLWSKRFADPLSDAESFKVNSDFEVIKIGSQEKISSEIMGQYMGLLSFSPNGWNSFKDVWNSKNEEDKLAFSITEILQELILKGNPKIKGIPYSEIWGEVDIKEDLILYEKLISKNSPILKI